MTAFLGKNINLTFSPYFCGLFSVFAALVLESVWLLKHLTMVRF